MVVGVASTRVVLVGCEVAIDHADAAVENVKPHEHCTLVACTHDTRTDAVILDVGDKGLQRSLHVDAQRQPDVVLAGQLRILLLKRRLNNLLPRFRCRVVYDEIGGV